MAKKEVSNALLDKLKAKERERTEKYRNKYVDGKDFVTFPDFREQLEDRVELMCMTKMRQHVKDSKGNFVTDENGEYLWEDIYAFIDLRYPDNWSFGGSALRNIYNSLVDDETTEYEVNEMLNDNPITFYLETIRLENGKNKGKPFTAWLMDKPDKKSKK